VGFVVWVGESVVTEVGAGIGNNVVFVDFGVGNAVGNSVPLESSRFDGSDEGNATGYQIDGSDEGNATGCQIDVFPGGTAPCTLRETFIHVSNSGSQQYPYRLTHSSV